MKKFIVHPKYHNWEIVIWQDKNGNFTAPEVVNLDDETEAFGIPEPHSYLLDLVATAIDLIKNPY